MSDVRHGREIKCATCASPIPVEITTGTVHCPFCGSAQELSQEIAQGLASHERAVDGKLRAANEHYLHANAWQQWSRMDAGQSPGARMIKFYLWGIGLPMALSLLAMAVHKLEWASSKGPELAIGLMVVSLIAVFGFVWQSSASRRGALQRAQLGSTVVACPNCGAKGTLTPGQSVDSCEFCAAALIPTKTIMSMRLDDVKVELRRAAMARFREERLGMAKLMGFAASGLIPYFAFGPVLAGLGIAMIAVSTEMARGREPFHPMVFVGWGVFGGCIGGFALYRSWKANRLIAWRQVIGDIAAQFHGQMLPRVLDWVGWLNTYWPSSYKVNWIVQGNLAASASLHVAGYPTLLIGDLVRRDQHRAAKLHILVSAWIPGVSEGTQKRPTLSEQGRKAKQALLDAGFQIHVSAAGVMAEASQATIDELRKHPSAAHVLAPTLTLVSEIAEGAGGIPSAPLR